MATPDSIPVGYVFEQAVCRGPTADPGGIYALDVSDQLYTGPAYLKDGFFPVEMRLERGQSIKDLVVIRRDFEILYVAKKNYFDSILKEYFKYDPKFKKYYAIERQIPHLEQDWKDCCTHKQFQKSFRLTGRKKDKAYLFELAGRHFRFPVFGFPELDCLKGENGFFPASQYFFPGSNGRRLPRSLYKSDGSDVSLPRYCRGRFKSKRDGEKTVHVMLHGCLFPHKWHYNVLKHMLGLSRFGQGRAERERWEDFEGEAVTLPEQDLFKQCRPNQKDTSCDMAGCGRGGLYQTVHPHIREHCRRFLKKAVTFWMEQTTKQMKVWEGNPFSRKSDPHVVQIISENEVKHNPFGIAFAKKGHSLDAERLEKLVVRGFSHNWRSCAEPTVHLHIVTLFAGELRGIPTDYEAVYNRGAIVATGDFCLEKPDA